MLGRVPTLRRIRLPQSADKAHFAKTTELFRLQATPTAEELELLKAMLGRVRTLCRTAADANLRIMIDAEHQYFQPAIDSIAKARPISLMSLDH
jgi:Proline dehydrogenase